MIDDKGLAQTPCTGCGTAVTVYPPEDGQDCRATCGRCAGTALAVVHGRVSAELADAVAARVAEKVAEARRRQALERRARAEKTRRRDAGLRARHAAKLARGRD